MRAGIAIGSNLGDRHVHLTEAISNLYAIHEGGEFLCSNLHETDPVDCPPDSPPFLNAVAELETSLSPQDLLSRLKAMEVAAGRPEAHTHHAPRCLDLDLLYCDDMSLQTPELELPHPRITERTFVLAPLAEIRPFLQLPGWSKRCEDFLK